MDDVLVDDDLAQTQIDPQATDLANRAAHRRPLVLAAPKQGADVRDELGQRAGRRDAVVGAELERDDPIDFALAGAQDNHWDRADLPQFAEHVETREFPQIEIEQHEVDGAARGRAQRGVAVGDLLDLEARPAQNCADRLAQLRRRIGKQDSRGQRTDHN
jgi:hypothetical protein